MRHDVDAVFDQFEKELKKLLKIEPGELPQSAMVKIELAQQITVWLDNLVQWYIQISFHILKRTVPNGASPRANEFFQEMYAQFKHPAAEEAATKPGPSKSLSEVFDPSDDPNEAMDTW